MDQSLFKLFSYGRAAANLEPGQLELEVIPFEHMNYVDGEVTDHQTETQVQGVDASGNSYTSKMTSSISVKAKWLRTNNREIIPPLIVRGEKVEIYRYADTDQFFWKEAGDGVKGRARDAMVLAFSNTADHDADSESIDNSYQVEVNTVTKLVQVRTNKSDGEPFAYVIQINTKAGVITLMDDVGNSFILDSKERHLKLQNTDNSIIEINKTNGMISVPETFDVKCTDMNVECSNSYNLKTSTATENASDTFAITGGGGVTITGPTIGLSGTLSGSGGSGASFDYKVDIAGSTSIGGGASIDGSLTNNGTNVGSSHKHDEQGDGKPTSGPY